MNVLIINCSPVRDGATARICELATAKLAEKYDAKSVCIDDYSISFCLGCRSCHETAQCVIEDDDVRSLIAELDRADAVLCVSPSYWADVPGQFKVFIDRCTPWCNTHEPHAALTPGKKGWCIALRTGPGMRECGRIAETIEHFYGHMEIEACGSLGLCGIECRGDVEDHLKELEAFLEQI